MFDELDDPTPFAPRPGARDAVTARAARIRRNRRTGYVASAASLVLVAAALSAGMRGGPEGLRDLQPVSSLSPSESPSPAGETPEPTASASASPSASAAAEPRPSGPPESAEPSYIEWPSGCTTIDGLPSTGKAPHADLSVALEIADVVDPDARPSAKIVVTNASATDTYAFSLLPLKGSAIVTAAMDDAGHRSGYPYSDYISVSHVEVGPGGTDEVEIAVGVETCDENGDRTGVLPPGEYRMAVGFRWENLTVLHGETGTVAVEESPETVDSGNGLPPLTPTPSPSPSEEPAETPTPDPEPTESPSPTPLPGRGVWGTVPVSVTVT